MRHFAIALESCSTRFLQKQTEEENNYFSSAKYILAINWNDQTLLDVPHRDQHTMNVENASGDAEWSANNFRGELQWKRFILLIYQSALGARFSMNPIDHGIENECWITEKHMSKHPSIAVCSSDRTGSVRFTNIHDMQQVATMRDKQEWCNKNSNIYSDFDCQEQIKSKSFT